MAQEAVAAGELESALRSGEPLVPAGAGRRALDAQLLRKAVLIDAVDGPALLLSRLDIQGELDLSGADLGFAVTFDDCTFDSPLVVHRAALSNLIISGCRLPGLLANGVRIAGDLDLSRSTIRGLHPTSASRSVDSAVWLCESQIGGRLLAVDTRIHGPGQRAVQADGMHVAGTVRLIHDFEAHGEIRLLSASIGGSLDLTGALLTNPYLGLALDLGNASIGGSVFIIPAMSGRNPVIEGRVDAGNAHIGGTLILRSATVTAQGPVVLGSGYGTGQRSGSAINATKITIDGDLAFEDGTSITGGIDLSLATLGRLWVSGGTRLRAPGHDALDLMNATLLSEAVFENGFACEGTLRVSGAHLQGRLDLKGTTWSKPADRISIAGHGVRIDGAARLDEARVREGAVKLNIATLGGDLSARQAALENGKDVTLDLTQATIAGSVDLQKITSTGFVALNRTQVFGRVDFADAQLRCPGTTNRNPSGHALQVISANVGAGLYLGWHSVDPGVDLSSTATTILADDPEHWPGSMVVSGLTYDRFERPTGQTGAWDWEARARWLGRQQRFDSGPYEQAARVYRTHGLLPQSERILMAGRAAARRADLLRALKGGVRTGIVGVVGSLWQVFLSIAAGYGYRPARAVGLLAILLAMVTISLQVPAGAATMRATGPSDTVYAVRQPLSPERSTRTDAVVVDRCGGDRVRCFNAFFYAFDTVVPLVSVGQRDTWHPSERQPGGLFMAWWLNIATIIGWILSSIFVLAWAKLSRSPG